MVGSLEETLLLLLLLKPRKLSVEKSWVSEGTKLVTSGVNRVKGGWRCIAGRIVWTMSEIAAIRSDHSAVTCSDAVQPIEIVAELKGRKAIRCIASIHSAFVLIER